jgi:hypothetical protein
VKEPRGRRAQAVVARVAEACAVQPARRAGVSGGRSGVRAWRHGPAALYRAGALCLCPVVAYPVVASLG